MTATDPDGDPIALSAVGLPANAQFHDNGDGTGTFTFVPDVTQWIGSPYSVTFQAEDGTFFDYASASITVTP